MKYLKFAWAVSLLGIAIAILHIEMQRSKTESETNGLVFAMSGDWPIWGIYIKESANTIYKVQRQQDDLSISLSGISEDVDRLSDRLDDLEKVLQHAQFQEFLSSKDRR